METVVHESTKMYALVDRIALERLNDTKNRAKILSIIEAYCQSSIVFCLFLRNL